MSSTIRNQYYNGMSSDTVFAVLSKFRLSSAAGVLGVRFGGQSAPTQPVLLLHHELLSLQNLLLTLLVELLLLLTLLVHLHLSLALALTHLLLVHLLCLALHLHDAQVAPYTGLDDQVVLLGARAVGVVDDESSREAGLHGSGGDHFQLMFAIGVELQYCPASDAQAVIEGLEEFAAPLEGIVALLPCNTEPLDGGDADDSVEDSGPELPALPDVHLPQPRTHLLLGGCDVQHVPADVHPLPHKSVLLQCLSRYPRSAADVQHEGSALRVQQFDGPFGQLPLDGLDACVGLVL